MELISIGSADAAACLQQPISRCHGDAVSITLQLGPFLPNRAGAEKFCVAEVLGSVPFWIVGDLKRVRETEAAGTVTAAPQNPPEGEAAGAPPRPPPVPPSPRPAALGRALISCGRR